ncbi:MAG: HPr kinase/phosphorylase [Parasphingorhabdus sp.]|jgi:HPr kinase/phosphorylase
MNDELTVAELFHSKSERLGMKLEAGANGLRRTIARLAMPESEISTIGYWSTGSISPVRIIRPDDLDRLSAASADDDRNTLLRCSENDEVTVFVVSDDLGAPDWLLDICNKTDVCIYRSSLSHSLLFERLLHRVARKLLENVTLHGVLMSIMNVGVLIQGASGIGKSEVALDLINRGHRLVADDAVQLYRSSPYKIRGYCPELIRGYLEVRGLGILDITDMFGNTAVQDSLAVDLAVHLTSDDQEFMQDMDRLTPKVSQLKVLDVSIPEIHLLVAPGRNLSVLVEAAVRTHIQHQFGRDPVKEFIDKQQQLIERRNRLLNKSS